MPVRLANESDLERVNALRKQVNDLHVAAHPEVFKAGFPAELRDHIFTIWNDREQDIIVSERDGEIAGFAVLHHVVKGETPFMKARDFLEIEEICVDESQRRKGIASELLAFSKDYARERGFRRIELNMWEFNADALRFYEASGFRTYRRDMELLL